MSKIEKYLSKSIMRPEILFFNHSSAHKEQRTELHAHTFWQLELIDFGEVEWLQPKKKLAMGEKSILLLPPKISHGFEYASKSISFVSIKFDWNNNDLNILDGVLMKEIKGNMLRHFSSIFDYVLGDYPLAFKKEMLTCMLNIILLELTSKFNENSKNLYEKMIHFLHKVEGRRVKVSEIAQALHISIVHASREFKREHGDSLKHYIDENTAISARNYLKYTGYSIAQISDILEFPDVYSFSHFIKKMTGKSPRDLRQ